MRRHAKGQGLVEYALILVVVATAVIALSAQLEIQIMNWFDMIVMPVDINATETGSMGQSAPSVGEANIQSSTTQTTLEWEDAEKKIIVLGEEAETQEESLEEGVDLTVEAVVEGLEVLIDYADDIDNQALFEALSQVVQDIKDGDLAAVPDSIDYLVAELEEIPPEVWTALSLKMAPRLIESCETVSGGFVSPDAIAEAQEALEQLDPDYPGKAEKQQLLQEAVDIIEERQSFSLSWLEVNSYVLDLFIVGLESAGEFELAEQLAADSEACGF